MPNSENAKLEYEAGQVPVAMTALTDQGDFLTFKSTAPIWSGRAGSAPDVKPNGVATGFAVTVAASASDDVVDVAAGTLYLAGVLTSVGADADLSIPRPAVSDYQKISITVNSGGALAVVEGAEHTAFSTTRGANGGPPWIPTGSVEIAQIWYDSQVSAAVAAAEIKQTPGVYREMYLYPTWSVVYAAVENGILGYAGVTFDSALSEIHSDDAGSTTAGKLVYASYSTPDFAEMVDAYDFVPPENSHTITSKQVYGRTKGSKASNINQGTFSVDLQDGISDNVLQFVNDFLWFRFYQNRLNTPYILTQGYLGIGPSFPAGDEVSAACTLSAPVVSMRVTS